MHIEALYAFICVMCVILSTKKGVGCANAKEIKMKCNYIGEGTGYLCARKCKSLIEIRMNYACNR